MLKNWEKKLKESRSDVEFWSHCILGKKNISPNYVCQLSLRGGRRQDTQVHENSTWSVSAGNSCILFTNFTFILLQINVNFSPFSGFLFYFMPSWSWFSPVLKFYSSPHWWPLRLNYYTKLIHVETFYAPLSLRQRLWINSKN